MKKQAAFIGAGSVDPVSMRISSAVRGWGPGKIRAWLEQAARLALLLAGLAAFGNCLAEDAAGAAEADWARRSRAEGVVVAVGFDDIRDWAKYNWDREHCNPDYQVRVEGRLAGCRNNAWDSRIKTSGRGSLRFDILPRTGEDGGGNLAIPFSEQARSQFGAQSEFWVSWRQRMDERYYRGYRAHGGGTTHFKQAIIAQGDLPAAGRRGPLVANACSEAELVIVSSAPEEGPAFPMGYLECRRYRSFEERLGPRGYVGNPGNGRVITRQNRRLGPQGESTCIAYPPGKLDQSGCFNYRPDEWVTYMVHLKLGPAGQAVSSVSGYRQPGYVDSTYELYAARPGEDFQLLHRQTEVVIPRGQHYLGGDPVLKSSYEAGWTPYNAHPEARYGKLWLLSYMTGKDEDEVTAKASTWYDEVIVSRCRIAAPGFPAGGEPCPAPEAGPGEGKALALQAGSP